jgi:hypothetical protein
VILAGMRGWDGVRVANNARVAEGARVADSAWAAVGVRECAADGCCRPPPWCAMLMVATTSWSTSWRHCSAADGEAFGDGGLLSS